MIDLHLRWQIAVMLLESRRKLTGILVAKLVRYLLDEHLVFMDQFFRQIHLLFLEVPEDWLSIEVLELRLEFTFGEVEFFGQKIDSREAVEQVIAEVILCFGKVP